MLDVEDDTARLHVHLKHELCSDNAEQNDTSADPWANGKETPKMKKLREAGDLAGLEKYKQAFIKSKIWHSSKSKNHKVAQDGDSHDSHTGKVTGGPKQPAMSVRQTPSIYSKDIIGKHLAYIDTTGWRINKVVKLDGNTITVADVLGSRKRIHPETVKILGIYVKTENNEVIVTPIDFNIHSGPRLKARKQKAELHKQVIKALVVKTKRKK